MRKAPLLWLLTGLVLQPGFAAAGDRRDFRPDPREELREERREERHEPHSPASEAARRAQSQNGGGRVLDVNPTEGGYRVKLLKQGEVRVIMVPGQN